MRHSIKNKYNNNANFFFLINSVANPRSKIGKKREFNENSHFCEKNRIN